MKDHRIPASSNPMRQSRKSSSGKRRRHWVWGALSSAVLTVAACEWITPLDFGGNSNRSNATDSGQDADGGNVGGGGGVGGSTTAGGCKPGCRNDQTCAAGKCTCPEGQPECDGTCIESLQAAGYCGECNITCRADQICKGGKCTCRTGQTECDDTCIESLEDAGYCGVCDITCRADQICGAGSCGCRQGENECSNLCVNLTTDSQHCGVCDTRCQSGQTCVDGTCKTSPCDGLCAIPEIVSAKNHDTGYRFEPVGTTERCIAIEGYLPTETNPRLVCWNLDANARQLRVDGQPIACQNGTGVALSPRSWGWYCVQVSAGADNSAGLLLPTT